jgi:NAD(P)H-nitrite reductase large subunit
MTRYVIVGNGAAGVTAAETVRAQDPRGHITIISGEPGPMYSRPGLAYVVINEVSDQQVVARREAWYGEQRIALIFGRAVKLDLQAHCVVLEDGRAPAFDQLLIATGARAMPLPYPGADLEGVVYLDTLAGTRDLLRQARTARRAVVIGGGITALELAEGLRHHGLDTHYFVRKRGLWSAVFNEMESGLLEDRLRGHGVQLHFNTEIEAVVPDEAGRVAGVRLTTGETFACDLVGAAIGVRPQLELAAHTPLRVERGLVVDEYLQTNVPGVFAAGDCAQVYDRWSGEHLLDVLWPTAVAAGRVAGRNMAGARQAYVKGTPFNACRLFGLHVSAIGQLGNGRGEDAEAFQTLSRGSSEVWATRPHGSISAWSQDGANTLRLMLSGNRLAGALVVGRQTLADPLRGLIENQTEVSELRPYLNTGGPALEQAILRLSRQRETLTTIARRPDQ